MIGEMLGSLRKTVFSLYAFSFFDDFILIYPLYTIMFADAGLGAFKISSLLAAWSFTSFILEVPSGSIADKYPRRQVLIMGMILRAVGYGFWLFHRTYLGFLIGFILWGIKSALTSGTVEALVYDELSKQQKLPLYAKITGRMQSLGLMAVAAASFGASALAHKGYNLILALSIASVLAAALAIYLLPKAKLVRPVEEAKYADYLQDGVKQVLRSPKILYIMGFMSIVAGLGAIDEYFSLFFKEKAFTNAGIAFWTAVITLLGSLGGFFAHKVERKRFHTEWLLVVWAALLFGTTIVPKMVAPIMLGLYFMFFVATQVVFNAHLQNEIADKTRATATSVGGLTSEVFALMAYGIVGLGAHHSGYAYAYKLVAGAVVVAAAALFLYNRRAKVVL